MIEIIAAVLVAAIVADGEEHLTAAEMASEFELEWRLETAEEAINDALGFLEDGADLPSGDEAAYDIGLHPSSAVVYLSLIEVPRGQRGFGRGRLLLQQLESHARDLDAEALVLLAAEIEFGVDPRGFYWALGYRTYLHHRWGTVMVKLL